jgi:hypothetical protein
MSDSEDIMLYLEPSLEDMQQIVCDQYLNNLTYAQILRYTKEHHNFIRSDRTFKTWVKHGCTTAQMKAHTVAVREANRGKRKLLNPQTSQAAQRRRQTTPRANVTATTTGLLQRPFDTKMRPESIT